MVYGCVRCSRQAIHEGCRRPEERCTGLVCVRSGTYCALVVLDIPKFESSSRLYSHALEVVISFSEIRGPSRSLPVRVVCRYINSVGACNEIRVVQNLQHARMCKILAL